MSRQKWSSLETYTILIVRPSPDGVLAAALWCRHHGTPVRVLFLDVVRAEDVPLQVPVNKRVIVIGASLSPTLAEALLETGWELDVTTGLDLAPELAARLRKVAGEVHGRYAIRSGAALCTLVGNSVADIARRGLAGPVYAVAADALDPDRSWWEGRSVTAYLAQLISWVGPRAVLVRLVSVHAVSDALISVEAVAYRDERGEMIGTHTMQDIRDLLADTRSGYNISQVDLEQFFTSEADLVRGDVAQAAVEILLDALDGFLTKKHGADWDSTGK